MTAVCPTRTSALGAPLCLATLLVSISSYVVNRLFIQFVEPFDVIARSAEIGRELLKDTTNTTLSYNPEFIAQGDIIRGLLNPDMVLIGEGDKRVGDWLEVAYKTMTENQVSRRFDSTPYLYPCDRSCIVPIVLFSALHCSHVT